MRYAIFVCFVLSTNTLQAQLQVLSVLPNPEKLHSGFRISHSLGEPCIQQQQISPYIITEGFQQGHPQIALSSQFPENPDLFSISPNPASDYLIISWSSKTLPEMEIIVLRTDGIVVKKQRLSIVNSSIFIGDIIPGSYIIQGYNIAGNLVLQHPIVKI